MICFQGDLEETVYQTLLNPVRQWAAQAFLRSFVVSGIHRVFTLTDVLSLHIQESVKQRLRAFHEAELKCEFAV